ncbi:hypothetical protein [Spirillospora sp. CA-294931]|uniref:hypothetical protein n=1 Tax=Spirillospora sp. CA-294931 TaxID=3240042 RepID=UPI003D928CF9
MSDEVIFMISLGVTMLGLFLSWGVAKRRGAASGLRGASLSLVPLAAAMTGVTEFFIDLTTFSLTRWAGVGVAGLAVLLYLTSGFMLGRRAQAGEAAPKAARERRGPKPAKPGKAAPKGEVESARPATDPDLAEIEEILRNRGID